jgi:penicillin-binding protein 1C
LCGGLLVGFWFCLPAELFPGSYATVVLARDGRLLGARVAEDGQWRFPEAAVVPDKFARAVVLAEDKYFYWHPGINPVAVVKALRRNMTAGTIKSGASTITMQVLRLARNSSRRTYSEKAVEALLSLRLEVRSSKKEILALYAAHAPFGGNVVGLEAAAWRYFGRPAADLSWAEAALLAVLPNAPSLIHLGQNRPALQQKRDRLLRALAAEKYLSDMDYRLAIAEPVPEKPRGLPGLAPHMTERINHEHPGRLVTTTVDAAVQERVNLMVAAQAKELQALGVNNAAAVVVEVGSGNILAYTGNVPRYLAATEAQDVDILTSRRSTGSILKPFLYYSMLADGATTPTMLVPDIPTRISGFKPENYNLEYYGAVPAKMALARSLNIPCVRMLQSYGVPKFYTTLKKYGMHTLDFGPEHYGLSLILGGAEGNLIEITGMYATLARSLNYFNQHYRVLPKSVIEPSFYNDAPDTLPVAGPDPGAVWLTFEALQEVNRPDAEMGWKFYENSSSVAWKTGTSFGYRDAWAVGVTPRYAVGVWAGNADGEGRPGLTGIGAAAPLLFKIFSFLGTQEGFAQPTVDLKSMPLCKESGYPLSTECPQAETTLITRAPLTKGSCPYHVKISTTLDGKYRVNADCSRPGDMVRKTYFILPPIMEGYYKMRRAFYEMLPPYRKGCNSSETRTLIELLYPTEGARIIIGRGLDGTREQVVFQAAHHQNGAVIFWHLDDEVAATTRGPNHQIVLRPLAGRHRIYLVDNEGNTLHRDFEVVWTD